MMVLIKSMDIFFYEKIFSPIAMHVTTVASSCFNSIISWSSEIVAQNNILFSLSDMTLCLTGNSVVHCIGLHLCHIALRVGNSFILCFYIELKIDFILYYMSQWIFKGRKSGIYPQ